MLERKGENLTLALFLPIPLLFVLVGAMGFYTIVFRVKLQPYHRRPANPVAGRRLVAGVLIIAGSLLFMAFLLVPVRHAFAARSWRDVECTILRSEIRRHHSSKGSDAYSPEILYSYVVDGKEHRSDTYSFFGLSRSGWAAARRKTDGYRAGSTVTCYVNPNDPDDATLHRNPSLGWMVGLIPLALLTWGIRAWPRQNRLVRP